MNPERERICTMHYALGTAPMGTQRLTISSEPSTPPLWKAGRITGWIEALIENAPQTFRSFTLEEHLTVLQEV